MIEAEKISHLEKRVKTLMEQVEFINRYLGIVPDKKMLDEAIMSILLNRDATKLASYIKLGGKLTDNLTKEKAA
jgi:hypothetical protein